MTSEIATCVRSIRKVYSKFEVACECTMSVLLYITMITILVVMH